MPSDNVLTIEQVLQKIMTPMKSNIKQDQLTTKFGSDFNNTHPDYDQTSLPTPIVNPKLTKHQYMQLLIHVNQRKI